MRGNRGYNQESIQDMNRTLLINLLRKEGICARAHLSNLSMLKQATVTNIMNDFIHWGLVKEVGFLVGNKGRRSIGISINNDDFGVLGIRLGRKNYTVGLFDLSGNLVEYKRNEVEAGQKPREIFDNIKGEARELIGSAKGRKIIAVGMAIPGPYSERRGRIELMTGVSGWNEISIKEELTEDFKLPVFVEQDANAGALAQYWHKEEDYKNSVLVYVADGQGVGAGIISNGELLKGSIGVAGEIGHTTIDLGGSKCACGNYGCLENYCSSIAFTRKVNEELQPAGLVGHRPALDQPGYFQPFIQSHLVISLFCKIRPSRSWQVSSKICRSPASSSRRSKACSSRWPSKASSASSSTRGAGSSSGRQSWHTASRRAK